MEGWSIVLRLQELMRPAARIYAACRGDQRGGGLLATAGGMLVFDGPGRGCLVPDESRPAHRQGCVRLLVLVVPHVLPRLSC